MAPSWPNSAAFEPNLAQISTHHVAPAHNAVESGTNLIESNLADPESIEIIPTPTEHGPDPADLGVRYGRDSASPARNIWYVSTWMSANSTDPARSPKRGSCTELRAELGSRIRRGHPAPRRGPAWEGLGGATLLGTLGRWLPFGGHPGALCSWRDRRNLRRRRVESPMRRHKAARWLHQPPRA